MSGKAANEMAALLMHHEAVQRPCGYLGNFKFFLGLPAHTKPLVSMPFHSPKPEVSHAKNLSNQCFKFQVSARSSVVSSEMVKCVAKMRDAVEALA